YRPLIISPVHGLFVQRIDTLVCYSFVDTSGIRTLKVKEAKREVMLNAMNMRFDILKPFLSNIAK
ncbi:hypothetical protein P3708_24805, partial [Vibrio parahaemolyticus]|nr:hypothetical protein [Vibrio parahaemolyticus]